MYQIPKGKATFINKSIADADIPHALSQLLPQGSKLNRKVVFFFDPPWGGLDYKEKVTIELDDFEPYPMRQALVQAFSITSNVMLKLPKNQDIPKLISDLRDCFIKGRKAPKD